MATRLALNGFGRIGRTIFKVILDRKLPLEVAALNDLADPSELAYLLKYDSVHGVWPHEVSATADAIVVDGKPYRCTRVTDPAQSPWKELKVAIVLEGTGRFTDAENCRKHLGAGAQKVIAIEIAPEKWPCLERTFAKEIAEGRVVLLRQGAWDSESTLELGGDSVVLERGSQKQKVRVTTIDQMVLELKLPRVDFITMDIEGAEKPALRGAVNTLKKFRPRMAIASEHLPDDTVAIPKTVHAMVPEYEAICGQCNLVDRKLLAQVIWFK